MSGRAYYFDRISRALGVSSPYDLATVEAVEALVTTTDRACEVLHCAPSGLDRVAQRLVEERAELLAALELVVGWMESIGATSVWASGSERAKVATDAALAAIAKAKGGAK